MLQSRDVQRKLKGTFPEVAFHVHKERRKKTIDVDWSGAPSLAEVREVLVSIKKEFKFYLHAYYMGVEFKEEI